MSLSRILNGSRIFHVLFTMWKTFENCLFMLTWSIFCKYSSSTTYQNNNIIFIPSEFPPKNVQTFPFSQTVKCFIFVVSSKSEIAEKINYLEYSTRRFKKRNLKNSNGYIENDAYVSNFIMTSQEEILFNHITRLSRILLFHW
jgi:hypothetical protein